MQTLVPITKADLIHVGSLSRLFDQYRVFYGKESDPASCVAFLSERIANGESQIFIAFAGMVPAGFVQLYPSFSSTRMKRLWILNDLFVDPQFRGNGISVALIDRAKQWCLETGACALTLETTKDNAIGNKLYEKCGFKKDIHHNYYELDI